MKKKKEVSRRYPRRRSKDEEAVAGNDEVDQLLEAAQDELLLKLSLNSHMSRVPPDYLHPDLNRRFQDLKSSSSSSSKSTAVIRQPSEQVAVNEDDLLARFGALKKGTTCSSYAPGVVDLAGSGELDEEDEVERLVEWAKDAARLDPSPPSDDYEFDDYESDDSLEHEQINSTSPMTPRNTNK